MEGDIFTLDSDNNAAVRTVSVNAGTAETNSPVIFTTDENGNAAVRVVGAGGGDQHNMGYYATPEALREAVPTAEAGDWAIVGSTDTVWVWDIEGSDWVDTDTKGEVTPDMIIVKSLTMPSASTTPAGAVYQYIGQTNANYTHGYIYENVKTATYTSTVTFEAATLSSSTIACSGSDFAAFVAEWGSGDITTITNGTITYDQSGGLLVFVGKDADGTTVCTFQLYTEDYQDAGFTITGTLQDGDVFAFTCSISEASATYAWNRIDVQPAPVIPDPLPDQTGQSGKFLTTDGTDASWSDKPLVNTATESLSLAILGATSGSRSLAIGVAASAGLRGVAVGTSTSAAGQSVAIGQGSESSATGSVALGYGARVSSTASNAIQINASTSVKTNSDANTFKVGNANGNFELMSADGTIPTARLTKVNSTITLTAAGWSSNTQTVNVTGMTATGVVMVSPDPTDQADYTSAGIICSAQAAGTLTFTCDTVPSGDIDVNVVML